MPEQFHDCLKDNKPVLSRIEIYISSLVRPLANCCDNGRKHFDGKKHGFVPVCVVLLMAVLGLGI